MARPADVRTFFRAQLRPVVVARQANMPAASPAPTVRAISSDDPYGF